MSGPTARAWTARRRSNSAAKALYRRFTMPANENLVAAQFARLPYEARSRLTQFLADARRRQAHDVVGYR